MNHIEKSNYISASGHLVTLYRNKETDACFTVVDGEITLYQPSGDMACGCKSIEAALEFIK